MQRRRDKYREELWAYEDRFDAYFDENPEAQTMPDEREPTKRLTNAEEAEVEWFEDEIRFRQETETRLRTVVWEAKRIAGLVKVRIDDEEDS